jgi:hypothetical protein
LQKVVISEQRNRLRSQQREIEELRVMKGQIKLGRAVTNQELYKTLLQPERRKNVEILSR